MRTEVYRDSTLVEWFGVDGPDWVHVRDGAEVERRAATAEELAADQPPEAGPDLVALANEMADQKARLLAAEDVLNLLLLNDLEF